jgi:site-specific DNA recombinase
LLKRRATDHAVQAESLATQAVGYIRVSTEEQAVNGHVLEVQDRAIRSFAESQGYTLIEVVSDRGVSGAKRPEDRPGFQRVIDLARAQKFSMLLVGKFDRLARNLLFNVRKRSQTTVRRGAPKCSRTDRYRHTYGWNDIRHSR